VFNLMLVYWSLAVLLIDGMGLTSLLNSVSRVFADPTVLDMYQLGKYYKQCH
jgi:hypothetical protein